VILTGLGWLPAVSHAAPFPYLPAPALNVAANADAARREQYWKKIFDEMKDGSYERRFSEKDWENGGFPETSWEDIPILLRHAHSEVPLRSFPFPRNTFDDTEPGPWGCSEGIMALYLIEGVRRGGLWPPRPWCLKEGMKPKDSLTNRKEAMALYSKWWEAVRTMDRQKAGKVDPLKGSALRWYDGPKD
jgi:hypothetical protein